MPFNTQGSISRELSRRAGLTPEQDNWEVQMNELQNYKHGVKLLIKRWTKKLFFFLFALIAFYITGDILRRRAWDRWIWIFLFMVAAVFLILSIIRIWKIVKVYNDFKKVKIAI